MDSNSLTANTPSENPDDSRETPDSLPETKRQRRQVRRQLWAVLAGLLVLALAMTGFRWYQGEYIVPNRPLAWIELDWPTIEREMDRGRRIVLFVDMPAVDEPIVENSEEKMTAGQAAASMLAAFETPEVRQKLYYASVLAVKLQTPTEQETIEEIRAKLSLGKLPACVIGSRVENRTVLDQHVTAEQIADTIGKLFGE